jgi:hypothetical protein
MDYLKTIKGTHLFKDTEKGASLEAPVFLTKSKPMKKTYLGIVYHIVLFLQVFISLV